MKNETKDLIKVLGNNDPSAYGVILSALQIDDKDFENAYPALEESISKVFEDKMVRKNIWEELNTKATTLEIEMESINAMKEIIDSEDSLSERKLDMLKLFINYIENITKEFFANPRPQIPVKIKKLRPDAVIPKYAHIEDAGADVYATEDITIKPNATVVVPLGFATSFSPCYRIQVVPRSGLSLKTKMRIANAPGTIEGNYRGEYGVIIDNISGVSIEIKKGDRIAQIMIELNYMMVFEEVDELEDSDRGTGGFGSSGVNG